MLSIIVPTVNEAITLPLLMRDLEALRVPLEVIVADGGSADDTAAIAAALGARVVTSPPGRGMQLRAAASVARGDTYLFLHADARLPVETCSMIERLAAQCPPNAAFAFTLRIASEGWRYRLVEWGTARRSRIARLPYGDQGLLLSRETYTAAGGYPDLPIMEDVALVRALGRTARVHTLSQHVLVSARRWERDGVLRQMLRNWMLLLSYLVGVRAHRLAGLYRPEGKGAPAS